MLANNRDPLLVEFMSLKVWFVSRPSCVENLLYAPVNLA
jgi:hypothetical protein